MLSYSCIPRTFIVQQGIKYGHVRVVENKLLIWSWLLKSAEGSHGIRNSYTDDGPTPMSGPADGFIDGLERSGISIFGYVLSTPTYTQRKTSYEYFSPSEDNAYKEANDLTSRVLQKVKSLKHHVNDTGGEHYKTWEFTEWW